jgi:hypothetical protein
MLTLADGGRDGLDVDTLVAWCDSGRAGANVGPSMVLIDDAHRLSPSVGQAAGSAEQHRLNVIRGLRRLADGGSAGAPCAVPVLFSVPTASGVGLSDRERVYAEELAAETTAILRVDHPSGSGSSTITLEKNTGGPCGWMFPVRLHKPLGSEA